MKKFLLMAAMLSLFLSVNCARAKKEPMLIGRADLNRVLAVDSSFRAKANLYSPAPRAIEFLKSYDKPTVIEVFYGSWCSDSQREVPRFIKVMEKANNPNFKVIYIGVDRKKHDPEGLAKKRGIERVPTFILFQQGKEIGRIVETPEISIEEDLAQILARGKSE